MTSRFHIPPPRSIDGSLLPALLAMLLGVMLALQLTLTNDVDLPPPGPLPHVAAPPPPMLPATGIPTIVATRALFDPNLIGNAPGTPGATAANSPLGGATVAGRIAVGNRSIAIIQDGKRITRLAPGQLFHGWTLVSLSDTGARFRRDGETLDLNYGVAAPASAEPASEEDQQ